jgi:DNA-binding CsgD family transcriptional regulator
LTWSVLGGRPLIGRVAELAEVQAALASGRAVVLFGDAGVGKTRLLREALARWAEGGGDTEWVAATKAIRSIPFGAVSHLLPTRLPAAGNRVELLNLVARRLEARRGRAPVAVGIDDANLLDGASAGLLHQLAVRGLIVPVATARRNEPASDTVTALWKDHGRRITVRPLPDADVDELLTHALPGQIDPIGRRRLRRLAAGNPLLLGVLLADARDTGALRRQHGVWRWLGTTTGSPRLAELVTARLSVLDPTTRELLETIACGEPIPMSLLLSLASPAAVSAAERSGMAVVERSGARTTLRLAHPLYGEALRAHLPAAQARTIFGQLAGLMAQGPMRRHDDALQAGVWQLQAGTITHPHVLVAAARQAIARFDLGLAERLARAARGAGQGWEADFLLAQILEHRARKQEALAVLPDAPPAGGKQLAAWAITKARILYWGLGRVEQAQQVLLGVPATAPGQDLCAATRSWILLHDGRCQAALEAATSVIERADASGRAVIWAAMGGAGAAGMLGRLAQARRIAERGQAVADSQPDRYLWGPAQVGYGLCYALRATGRLAEARRLADDGYRDAIARDAAGMAGVWAGFRGVVAKAQGLLGEARAFLQEAIALVDDDDQYQIIGVCLAELAGTAALTGDAAAAQDWLARADARPSPANRLYDAWIELDRAWVHAATGALSTAVECALHAAKLAHDSHQPAFEATARYDAARLGNPADVCDRLRALAAEIDTGYGTVLADAATGLLERDPDTLAHAATQFTEHGHLLLAAEAAAAAASAHEAGGHPARALAIRGRVAALASNCPGARTPLLKLDGLGPLLTPRERQIALLATSLTSRRIADQLGLSVRTVNNTLARVYAKLGVSGRGELAAILDASEAGW